MLALFHKSAGPRRSTDLGALSGEVRDLLAEPFAQSRTSLDIRLAPGLPPVAIDAVQIQQVFVNILRNAIEAMAASPEGSRQLRLDGAVERGVTQIDSAAPAPETGRPPDRDRAGQHG